MKNQRFGFSKIEEALVETALLLATVGFAIDSDISLYAGGLLAAGVGWRVSSRYLRNTRIDYNKSQNHTH